MDLNTSSTTENPNQIPPNLKDFVFYSEAVVQTSILFIGICLNIMNYYILRTIHLSANFKLCLLALTITDFSACITGEAQLILEVVEFRGDLPFGYWNTRALADHLLYYLFLVFMCTSSLYVILVAIVRTCMILKPIFALQHLTSERLKVTAWIMFLVTFILFTPAVIFALWQVCYNDKEHPKCRKFFKRVPDAENVKYYLYLLSILFGPIVILTNLACLFGVKHALHRTTQNAHSLQVHDSGILNMKKKYSKINHTLTLFLVLDAVWILPTCVQYVALVVSPEDALFDSTDSFIIILDVIAEVFLIIRPVYNFFVYYNIYPDFKSKLCAIFCGFCYNTNRHTTQSRSIIRSHGQENDFHLRNEHNYMYKRPRSIQEASFEAPNLTKPTFPSSKETTAGAVADIFISPKNEGLQHTE